jgi:hypothetical protein
MPKFEYKFEVNLGEPAGEKLECTTEQELNVLGAQGWELVAVSPIGKNNSYTGYWFKRALN